MSYGGPRMNMSSMNGSNRRPPNMGRPPPDRPPTAAQHDDLIRFIYESWNKVSQEANRNAGASAAYYHEQESEMLKDFEPFDLEAYWGQRAGVQNNVQPRAQHL